MNVFEKTGKRTSNLNLLVNALKTTPPTSIEAADLFITKLRTRLSDRCIDHLCFLKQNFKSNNIE